jgi:hypothetical protein
MRIGNLTGNISNEINELGFTFTNKLKLLGFTLANYGDMAVANYETVTQKIDDLIRFWERFFLSLPGKITIYKTFLLSQINYFATIMAPNPFMLNSLEKKWKISLLRVSPSLVVKYICRQRREVWGSLSLKNLSLLCNVDGLRGV